MGSKKKKSNGIDESFQRFKEKLSRQSQINFYLKTDPLFEHEYFALGYESDIKKLGAEAYEKCLLGILDSAEARRLGFLANLEKLSKTSKAKAYAEYKGFAEKKVNELKKLEAKWQKSRYSDPAFAKLKEAFAK